MSAALVRAGHASEVATLDPPGSPWLAELPFPTHALGPSRGSYQYAPGLGDWLRARRTDFDALISHGLWQHHGFAAWRAWRGANAGPRFVFAHGMLDPWFKRTYPKKHLKKWLYWPWAESRVLRDARAVFFTCEEERRLARQSFWLYRANEAVCALGIEEPPLQPAPEAAFFARFPDLLNRRLFLYLGRIDPKKGPDLLLAAFAELSAAHPDLTLVMAGPGEPDYLAALRDAAGSAAPSICWPGMLTGELKWGALRAAETFILPSHQENFGIAVVEALACSRPVLISDQVNIWREIADDQAGLVAPDTLVGTRELLARWLALNPDERAAMGARARTSFEHRYRIDWATAGLVEQLRGFGVRD